MKWFITAILLTMGCAPIPTADVRLAATNNSAEDLDGWRYSLGLGVRFEIPDLGPIPIEENR